MTIVPQEPGKENDGYPYKRKFNELEKKFFSDIPLERFRDQSRLDLDLWHQALLNESAAGPAKDSKSKATDILSATSKAAAGIELIADAFSRPRCQWFPMADQLVENKQRLGRISYCSSVGSSLAATTSIRALAHLENGNSSAAAREIITSLRFSRSAAEDPSLTGVLLTMGMGSDACRHLPQLLTHPNWSNPDLEALSETIGIPAYLDHVDKSFKLERATGVYYYNALLADEPWASEILDDRLASTIRRVPRGWIFQNMACLADLWYDSNIHRYNSVTKRIADPTYRRVPLTLKKRPTPYTFISALQFPQVADIYQKAARVQSQWDLCSVLCALERHRRVHGELPEKLEALVPEFLTKLPHDYVTGLPPHYSIGADGEAELATLDWEKTGNPETFLCRVPSSE
ncbi:MAG: hypothetical protein R3F19_15990 [Verrucomicrobiales bacterium]